MGKCRHEQGLDDEGLCFLCLESGDDIYFDLQQRLAIQERINQNALGRIKEWEAAARKVEAGRWNVSRSSGVDELIALLDSTNTGEGDA